MPRLLVLLCLGGLLLTAPSYRAQQNTVAPVADGKTKAQFQDVELSPVIFPRAQQHA